MAFNFGTTTKLYSHTLLKNLEKYKEEQLYGFVGVFHISLTLGIKAIVSLIPIYLHFQKFCGVRNRPATEPVMLKVYNVKLSFDIWLVLYMHFILYS